MQKPNPLWKGNVAWVGHLMQKIKRNTSINHRFCIIYVFFYGIEETCAVGMLETEQNRPGEKNN